MNLYVGNLSPETSEQDLIDTFSEFGQVLSAKILVDQATGMPRGFGFVEMAGRQEGYDAVVNLDVTYLKGAIISVKEARAKGDNNSGGGYGDRQRRGGGGRPSFSSRDSRDRDNRFNKRY